MGILVIERELGTGIYLGSKLALARRGFGV